MLNNNSYQHSIYKKAFISHKIVDRKLSTVELAGCLRIAANVCGFVQAVPMFGFAHS